MNKFLLASLTAVLTLAATPRALAENHDFTGSYVMTGFYMDYLTEEFSSDDLPLVINEENVIDNFANYTPFTPIKGEVEGNVITFGPNNEDGYIVLDIDWDNFHYIVLNGETFSDEFEFAPITITYNEENDTYTIDSWMLWDYDPMTKEFKKISPRRSCSTP